MSQNFSIPGIRRLAAKHDRGEVRAAENFVHEREFELTIALTTQFRSEMTRPQPAFAHLGLQFGNNLLIFRIANIVRTDQHKVERLDFFTYKFVHPIQFGLKFRLSLKIPCHGLMLLFATTLCGLLVHVKVS